LAIAHVPDYVLKRPEKSNKGVQSHTLKRLLLCVHKIVIGLSVMLAIKNMSLNNSSLD